MHGDPFLQVLAFRQQDCRPQVPRTLITNQISRPCAVKTSLRESVEHIASVATAWCPRPPSWDERLQSVSFQVQQVWSSRQVVILRDWLFFLVCDVSRVIWWSPFLGTDLITHRLNRVDIVDYLAVSI